MRSPDRRTNGVDLLRLRPISLVEYNTGLGGKRDLPVARVRRVVIIRKLFGLLTVERQFGRRRILIAH